MTFSGTVYAIYGGLNCLAIKVLAFVLTELNTWIMVEVPQ